MHSTTTRGANADYGAPRNWDPERDGACHNLSVRVDRYSVYDQFTSTWKPSAQELAALNAGGVIEVHLVGTQCPMALEIVDPIGVVTVDDHSLEAKRPGLTINEEAHGI